MADCTSSKKRFNIKPFRTHQPMDRTDAQMTWDVLGNAIDEIYNRNASELSFEELYRNAYNLVLHKHGNLLYDGVTDKINSHLVDQTVETLKSCNLNMLLDEMSKCWKEHLITIVMIRDILMYMDRTYVVTSRRRPVYRLGLHLFRVTVWEHPQIKSRVTDLVLQSIANERNGQFDPSEGVSENRTRLKDIIGMLLELADSDAAGGGGGSGAAGGNNNDDHRDGTNDSSVAGSNHVFGEFESLFLRTTQEFYQAESLSYLSKNTAADYVLKAQRRLTEEKERATTILSLPHTTIAPLIQIIQTELIERHAKTLVDMTISGFSALLAIGESKIQEMQNMYDLFVRVPSSVDHLREALGARIKKDGYALIQDQQERNSGGGAAGAQSSSQPDPAAFCRGVLHMRHKYQMIVMRAFRNEKKAQKRMKESFEDFLNADARAASCLAVYVDELLRVKLRGMTEQQVNDELQKSITIFRYLSDKDVFESFYKQHLAKRLLSGRSVSDDAERTMVSLLKAECGYQFTTKLEGMFNDMRISRETRDKYKSHKRQHDTGGGIDIEVDVLTTGYWPSQNVPPCTLPVVVQQAITKFETFYLEKHTGRKLSWQTSAGCAELRGVFGNAGAPRTHELCVSTYQMCILLLFNDDDVLTLGQIRTKTHIPDQELRRQLISLCTPRNRILKKGSKGRGITSDDDTFTYNADYTSKLKRVRIPLVKETSIQQHNQSSAAGQGAAAGPNGAAGVAAAAGGGAAGGAAVMNKTAIDGSIPLSVEEDRRHLVEAAIVRIMKARKTLNHNDLIAEVTKQLSIRFTPTPVFIKKRIESLIEREYLERHESEHRLYMYVA